MEILHMAALAAVLLAAPFLLGMLFGKETVSGTYIAGVLLLWGSFEIVAVVANLRGWDFQMLSGRFLYVLVVLVCAGIAALCVRIIRRRKEKGTGEILLLMPAFLLVGSLFFVYAPKLESWYLVPETVNTILDANSLHGFHPLTGQPLSTPKEFGWSLMNLPAFYACLANWFQVDTTILLFRCIPLWMLLLSFLVYDQFAVFFFGKWKKGRVLFIWVYGLVLVLGDRAYMNEAYQMLHYAYEGRAVLTGILLPYCFYLLLTALRNQEGTEEEKKRISIFGIFAWMAEYGLLIASSLCVMGVDYGFGLPVTMTAMSCIIGLIGLIIKIICGKKNARQ